MHILSTVPFIHKNAQLLDPNHVNQNTSYMLDAMDEVQSKRYAKSVVVYPFHVDCQNGLSDGYSTEARSYRITAADTMWIDRMFLDGALISGAATVTLIDQATGLAPNGVINPIFTPTTTDQTLFNGTSVIIPANSTFTFTITGAAFVTDKLDLVIHLRTDRYNRSSGDLVQNVGDVSLSEADSLSATSFNSLISTITTAVTANTAKDRALKPIVFITRNFTNGTDVDLLRFSLPRPDSANYRSRIAAMYIYALYASAGGVGTTVTWTLQTAAGSTIVPVVCNMNGQTFQTAVSTQTTTVDIATTGAESLNSLDYRLIVANSSATVCDLSYCVLWIE